VGAGRRGARSAEAGSARTKGGRKAQKQNGESDVHLPQRKKKVSTATFFSPPIFFKALFGRFVARGVQKHERKKKRKSPSGLITKNAGFFSSVFCFFLPRLFCSIFFYRVFGRFVARGVQKRD
jgi:hypothetical protein